MKRRQIVLAAAAGPWVPSRAWAQSADSWQPTKPIHFIVSGPAGVAPDIIARLLSEHMAKALGQPILVENKPGAAGNIASDFVAKSPSDGHTIFLGINSIFCINPHIYPKLPFDALKDFAPISQLSRASYALIVKPDFPARSLAELIALARAQPGKLDYASSGVGSASHVITELLGQLAGVQMMHIPFTTTGLTEVMGGQIPFSFEPIFTAVPNIQSGRVRALAVSSPRRLPALPDVPAVAETYPGYDGDGWHGVFAPARCPRPIVQRYYTEIGRALKVAEVTKRLTDFGLVIVGGTPEQFDLTLRSDFDKWGRVTRASKITAG